MSKSHTEMFFDERETCKSQLYPGENHTIILVNLPPRCTVHQNNCCKIDQFKVGIYTQSLWLPARANRLPGRAASTSGTGPSLLLPLCSSSIARVTILLLTRKTKEYTIHTFLRDTR